MKPSAMYPQTLERRAIGATSALCLLPLVVALLAGCGTPRQTAYKTLATIGHTEAAAMQAAATLQAQGKLAADAWPQIAAAHDKFIPAYGAALQAAQLDYTQPASATVILLAQTVLDLVTKYCPQ